MSPSLTIILLLHLTRLLPWYTLLRHLTINLSLQHLPIPTKLLLWCTLPHLFIMQFITHLHQHTTKFTLPHLFIT